MSESAKVASTPVSGKLVFIASFTTLAASLYSAIESQVFNVYVLNILGKSPWHLTLMVSTSAIMGAINFIWLGSLSDNWKNRANRRKPFLLWGGMLMGSNMILFGLTSNFWICYVIDGYLISIGSNAFYVAQRVYVPENVPIESRGKVNGIANAFFGLGLLVFAGLMIGLLFLEESGDPFGMINNLPYWIQISLMLFGAIVVVSSALFYTLFTKEKVAPNPPKPLLVALKETLNIAELKKHKEFFRFFVAQFMLYISLTILLPYLINFITSTGFLLWQIIVLLVCYIGAAVIGNIVFGKLSDIYGRKKLSIGLIIVSGVSFIGLSLSAGLNLGFFWVMGFMIPAFMAYQGYNTTTNTLGQDLLPEEKRATFLGFLNLTNSVCQIPGVIIGGFTYWYFGIEWVFLPAGIWALIAFPFFFRVKETLQKDNEIKK